MFYWNEHRKSTMKKEIKLIMLSSIKDRTKRENEELERLFLAKMDWAWITGQLLRHRLEGYFISFIPDEYKDVLFFKVRQVLELISIMNFDINRSRVKIIEDIFQAVEQDNIKVAGLKGVVFNASIYGLNVRRSNDIDILVSEKDLQDIDNILRRQGFIQSIDNGKTEATRRQKLIQIMNHHDLVPYYKKVDHSIIDKIKVDVNIHFDSKENDITSDVLSKETMIYEKNGVKIMGLTWKLHLCHLMAHFFREVSGDIWIKDCRDTELYKLVDIENTIRSLNNDDLLEWISVVDKYNLRIPVFVTLYYLDGFFPSDTYKKMMEKLDLEILKDDHQDGRVNIGGYTLLNRETYVNKAFDSTYQMELLFEKREG